MDEHVSEPAYIFPGNAAMSLLQCRRQTLRGFRQGLQLPHDRALRLPIRKKSFFAVGYVPKDPVDALDYVPQGSLHTLD